jgi:hypothetical protein
MQLNEFAGHRVRVTHIEAARRDEGGLSPLAPTIAGIRRKHRERVFHMEQRKRSDLALLAHLRMVLGWSKALPAAESERIKAHAQALVEMGECEAKGRPAEADAAYTEWQPTILATIASRAPHDKIEAAAKKQMEALAKQLPVWPWVESVRGFGAVSLAVIVAEAGDLSNYDNPAKLWKRMGLAVMGGVRQGGLPKTASKAAWIEHGYNRQRRSLVFVIGESLIKGNADGPYRTLYLARKELERQKAEAMGLTVAPAAKIPAKRAAEFMSEGHVHRRAQRAMEKRLLRDLWSNWGRAETTVSPRVWLPASDC